MRPNTFINEISLVIIMRKSVRVILSILLVVLTILGIALISIFELVNTYTIVLMTIIPLVVLFTVFFMITSESVSERELRRFRRKILERAYIAKDPLLTRRQLSDQSVDIICCYNCKDIFVEKEKACDKCGAPKPNCIICGLDLTPETDPSDEVIITPCCSVYVHIEHMLEWLEIKEICPNCKKMITKENLIQIS
jgi:hypothetical protein